MIRVIHYYIMHFYLNLKKFKDYYKKSIKFKLILKIKNLLIKIFVKQLENKNMMLY